MSPNASERFIIGIDFGTTFSAAAWAIASDPKNIEVVSNWPTTGQLVVGSKVPTEIAYPDDPKNTKGISWGYDINPGSKKIKWFKLGLEPGDEDLALLDDLDAIDVTRDYLRQLHEHVIGTLVRRYTTRIIETATFSYVLTVPAIWSDIAKKRTEIAARKAGLGLDTSLQLLSEPESAAVYSLKTIENVLSTIKVRDRLVVCDAGGGTVDLVSYDLQQINPVLRVVECTTGTGDFCGSSFIDREFDEICQLRMGDAYHRLSVVHKRRIIKNFESCKMAFRDDPSCETFYVTMPNTVPDMPESRIVDGMFQLSRQEMRDIFDPIIRKVLDLIEHQVEMASTDHGKVNSILLVGGFGQSEYLYKRTSEWATPRGIQVLQPKEAAIAVVKGAVLKGLESEERDTMKHSQIARRARRSYGIPTKAIFVEGRHLEVDAEWDPHTGTKLAGNQVRWFIRANQLVDDNEVFANKFRRTFKKLSTWEDCLVSSPLPDPSTRIDGHVKKHCTITSDLTHLNLKANFDRERRGLVSSFYTAEYDLVMGLKNNNLNVSLYYQGNQYGVANIEFELV